MVRSEQDELHAVLADLHAEDWDRPSLCGDWRIRDVVAHLVSMNEAGFLDFMQATVSIHWFNSAGVRRRSSRTPAQLLDECESVLGMRGFGRVVPPSAMLVEWLVHSQDIRRALDVRRDIPSERLELLLRRCVSIVSFVPGFGFTGGRWRVRGLCLQATDISWTWGRGPEVAGSAEAILMAVLGRRSVLAELTGDGLRVLAARVS
jgi:uncharacterized protein (TIGR03083 family)